MPAESCFVDLSSAQVDLHEFLFTPNVFHKHPAIGGESLVVVAHAHLSESLAWNMVWDARSKQIFSSFKLFDAEILFCEGVLANVLKRLNEVVGLQRAG